MNNSSRLPLAIISIVISGLAFGLVGFWYGSNVSSTQTVTTSSPVATASASPTTSTTDPTAGWNNYTNTSLGFSLRYPDGWTVATDSKSEGGINYNSVSIASPQRANAPSSGSNQISKWDFLINAYLGPKNLPLGPNSQNSLKGGFSSLAEWISSEADNYDFANRSQVQIGGKTGYKGSSSGAPTYTRYFVQSGSYIFEIIPHNTDALKNVATGDSIINTLQFK